MRNLLSTSIFIFSALGLFAQTTLTQTNNGLVSGDNYTSREIQFVDAGSSGMNQIWDYSKIEYTNTDPTGTIRPGTAETLKDLGSFNLTLSESGYNYFLNATDNKIEEMGYINKEKNINLIYSNPVQKIKYPFSYGDQFTDPFVGVAYFNETYRIDFSGENNVSADAFGTLILPEMTLNNVLRVKTVKTGIQVNPCGSVKITIMKYSWYAPGYRYPVMTINTVENKFSNGKVEFTKTASTNVQQNNTTVSNVNNTNPGSFKPVGNNDVSVMLFPNPFSNNLTYNYFLRAQVPVSISLFDIAGKYSEQIIQNEVQSEGLHSGNLESLTNRLPAGVYYIRFIFDQQVVVNKVVKLENQ